MIDYEMQEPDFVGKVELKTYFKDTNSIIGYSDFDSYFETELEKQLFLSVIKRIAIGNQISKTGQTFITIPINRKDTPDYIFEE